jgi:thioredoxin 1
MDSTPKSFEDYIRSAPKPVLVDFWAEWCGPCKMMGPILHNLAQEWTNRIAVIKVNIDTKPHIAGHYGISAVPTMVLFQNGIEKHRVSGAMPLAQLKAELERFL